MKKFLCVFLALLLLASCAVAMAEASGLGQVELINPVEHKGRLVYIIEGNLYEDEAKKVPFVGVAVKLGICRSATDAKDFWELTSHVAEFSDLTTDNNGKWILRLPVRDSRNEDFLSGYGKTVYLWRKIDADNGPTYEPVCALVRPDELPDAAPQQESAEIDKYLVLEPEFGWQATTVTVRIQLRNDDKPFADQDVTLCKKGDARRAVAGKTDAEGVVTFELTQAMMEPGTVLTVVYSKNQEQIKEFTVPAAPTPIVMETVVTAAPGTQPTIVPGQRTETIIIAEQSDNSDGVLLKGLPLPLVIVLCAVFLVGYAVCWFMIKNPQKSRGKGV